MRLSQQLIVADCFVTFAPCTVVTFKDVNRSQHRGIVRSFHPAALGLNLQYTIFAFWNLNDLFNRYNHLQFYFFISCKQ